MQLIEARSGMSLQQTRAVMENQELPASIIANASGCRKEIIDEKKVLE